MNLDLDPALAKLAAAQASTFSRAQAIAHDLNDHAAEVRVRRGWLTIEAPGVYGLVGVAPSWRRSLWIAHLAVGPLSWLSHQAAAAILGVEGFPRGPVVLTAKHPNHVRVRGAVIHQSTDINERWVMTKPGWPPMTTGARLFVDLAAVCRYLRLLTALDTARSAGIVTIEDVAVALQALARRGKPGVRVLARVLDELGPKEPIPVSVLERMLFGQLERAGLPRPIKQFPLPGRQAIRGCADGGYTDAMMILEADGRRWHDRLRDLKRDRERDNEATRAGYVTLRFLHEWITSDPGGVIETVRETRRMRLALLAA
jgi:hypothetical protein